MKTAAESALTEAVFYILLSLREPLHGYGIMQETARMSGGRVHLAAGTLYGALNSLCEKGWIAAMGEEAGSRQKKYRLTADGLAAARRELERLEALAACGRAVLGGNESSSPERASV